MPEGKVVQVIRSGLAYLEEDQSKERFAFTFGKIRDYHGESAGELGLRVGSRVRFRTTDDHVKEVELVEPVRRSESTKARGITVVR